MIGEKTKEYKEGNAREYLCVENSGDTQNIQQKAPRSPISVASPKFAYLYHFRHNPVFTTNLNRREPKPP